MIEFLTNWLVQTWDIVLDSGTYLLAGFACAGLIYLLMPTEKVVGHLGQKGMGAVVKASLVGIPLPLCSCSVIPVASSMRQRGASRGATAGFLVSTPETGVDSIAISYALLGPALAIIRPLAALVTALAAGWLINLTDEEQAANSPESASRAGSASLPDEQAEGSCCGHAAESEKPSPAARIGQGFHYAFIGMFKDLSIYLVVGFLLAGLITALLPDDFFEKTVGSGWLAIALMLLVGLPLYVCATSSTPLAAALIAKGISPGAALVFLLVGPATNVATMVIVGKDLGRKSLLIYLVTIAVVAVLFALGTDALPDHWLLGGMTGHDAHQHSAGILTWICAILFVILVFNGLRLRYGWKFTAKPNEPIQAHDKCH